MSRERRGWAAAGAFALVVWRGLAGMLAAAMPARRAARIDGLNALAYE